jgi:hypothetical protein
MEDRKFNMWDWMHRPKPKQKTIDEKLDILLELSKIILGGITKMSTQLDDLKATVSALIADVAAEGNTVQAAVIAIQGLTGQITILQQELADAIAAGDPAAIQAAADAIKAQNDLIVSQTAALAAAIPATPDPVVPETPTP